MTLILVPLDHGNRTVHKGHPSRHPPPGANKALAGANKALADASKVRVGVYGRTTTPVPLLLDI